MRYLLNVKGNMQHAVSPDMAIGLGPLIGNSAEFWLNAQRAVNL